MHSPSFSENSQNTLHHDKPNITYLINHIIIAQIISLIKPEITMDSMIYYTIEQNIHTDEHFILSNWTESTLVNFVELISV
jgi:hypothetical protein